MRSWRVKPSGFTILRYANLSSFNADRYEVGLEYARGPSFFVTHIKCSFAPTMHPQASHNTSSFSTEFIASCLSKTDRSSNLLVCFTPSLVMHAA